MTFQTGERKSRSRALLVSAVVLGMLAFAGTPRASAEDYDRCQRRIAKADHKLHEAAEHHGWNSRQADSARRQLHEARERCWNERLRRCDEDGNHWHSDRDGYYHEHI